MMPINQELLKIRSKKLGLIMLDARVNSKKTIKECAEAMGVTNHKLHLYENGELGPTMPELEAFSFFLDIPVNHFLNGKLLEESEPEKNPTTIDQFKEVRQRIIATALKLARSESGKTLEQLASTTSIPASRLKRYENGSTAIPVPELEVLAETIDAPIENFLAQGGKVGAWRKKMMRSTQFLQLPENIQDFVSKQVNVPFLEMAMKLSNLPADDLRSVAEALLEITY
jgi:transcriptional regulator with XRE-family HTH domain